jgi:Uma2 family endonuclease
MTLETVLEQFDITDEENSKVTSGLHGVLGMRVGTLISNFVDANMLGYVTGADTEFAIEGLGSRTKKPDVAFVSFEKMPEPLDDTLPLAPDLAVEVISSTDGWKATLDKAKLYIQKGTKLVWVIDPYTKTILVFQPEKDLPLTLFRQDELTGEPVLPGFKLAVAKVFEMPKPK